MLDQSISDVSCLLNTIVLPLWWCWGPAGRKSPGTTYPGGTKEIRGETVPGLPATPVLGNGK